MMTMTELFYGPIEPTWFVHPQNQGFKRTTENPYSIYSDDAYTSYRCNPYMQRHAVPYTNMVAQEGTALRPGQGAMYPYMAQYLAHGANGTNVANATNGGTAPAMSPVQTLKQVQSPARPGVLQPRNVINVQTVHFMVPLCCGKCEDRVKEQLLNLDDVQRVTCDQWSQKVSVTSSIAPEKLLTRLQKIKKRTTFWPQQQSGAVKVFNGNQVSGNQHHLKGNNNGNHGNENDENSSSQM